MHQRNTQVEGLRSIAMLCVLLFHFFCRFQEIYMDGKSSLSWPFTLFGGIGVSTFFLISGYFFANADGGINFFIRRVKKLLPTYWVALIVCFLVTNLFQLPGRTAPFSDFLFNFLLLGGFPGIVFVDGAHWFLRTMLTIIVFYAIILRMSSKKHFSVYVVTVLFVMGLFFVELNVSYLQYAAKVLLNPSGLGLEYLVVTIMGSALAFIKKNEKKGFLLFVLCFASDIVLWDVSMSIAMLLMSVLLFLCERKK